MTGELTTPAPELKGGEGPGWTGRAVAGGTDSGAIETDENSYEKMSSSEPGRA